MWSCTSCNKTIKKTSKANHLKSKKHLENQQAKECEVCLENKISFKHCTQCVHDWCDSCHSKMTKCPFCRKTFTERPPQTIPRRPRGFNQVVFDIFMDYLTVLGIGIADLQNLREYDAEHLETFINTVFD